MKLSYLRLYFFMCIQTGFSWVLPPIKNQPSLLTRNIAPVDFVSQLETSSVVNGLGYLSLKQSSQKSLTDEGLIHASMLGLGLWTFLGWEGYSIGVVYFLLGNLVTKIKMAEKEKQGIAEKRGGRRGPENVWGAAATAMLCSIGTYVYQQSPEMVDVFRLGFLASLTTKLSDTFQSEIGKAYGKTTLLITTLERVPPGTEGAISLEGYLAGIGGSVLMAGFGWFIDFINQPDEFYWCLIAALIATTTESFLGAYLQQGKKEILSNEMVNLINTLVGALIAMGGSQINFDL